MAGFPVTSGSGGLLLPYTQSFVPSSQLPSGAPSSTRRVITAISTGSVTEFSGFQDFNMRVALTWPQKATRMRFRIRNTNVNTSTPDTTAVALTGAFIGTPNVASETYWQGDFTAAPTSLGLSFGAQDIGTSEYVSAWVTPTGQAAGQLFGISLGFTCATDSHINCDRAPGWTFHGATGAGASSAAGNAAVPSGGGITASPYILPFDFRIEYEFVGNNQIGVFLGSSLTLGFTTTNITQNFGHMGPDNSWPGMVGLRFSHGISNGGVSSATTANFATVTNQSWTRFKDPTTGTLFGGTVPDYAVIDLGVNDALFGGTGGGVGAPITVATYQANMQAIIAILQGLGINRIYVCTAPIGYLTSQFNLPTFQSGLLNAAVASGATTSLVTQTVTTTAGAYQTLWPSGPGGGLTAGTGSGPATNWFNGSSVVNQCWLELPASGLFEGPMTVTGVAGATTLTLTISSFSLVNAHKLGAPVLSCAEGYRQSYNYWLRQVPPGVIGAIDMAAISEGGGNGIPPIQKSWYYYSHADDVHPASPALYAAFAQQFAAGVLGL